MSDRQVKFPSDSLTPSKGRAMHTKLILVTATGLIESESEPKKKNKSSVCSLMGFRTFARFKGNGDFRPNLWLN